jgi:hypothetical protein
MDLQFFSILLEGGIAALAFLAGRRRKYMYGLSITFGIYVLYDAAQYYGWAVPEEGMMQIIFFIGTLAALYTVWNLYRRS